MSALSIWQKSLVSEAVGLLSRAYANIDLVISGDAVDENKDLESLQKNRDTISKAIENLKPLLDE